MATAKDRISDTDLATLIYNRFVKNKEIPRTHFKASEIKDEFDDDRNISRVSYFIGNLDCIEKWTETSGGVTWKIKHEKLQEMVPEEHLKQEAPTHQQ